MAIIILVTMFSAVPFGLLFGRMMYLYIIAQDRQEEEVGTREPMIFIYRG